jgi:hypothetical protein
MARWMPTVAARRTDVDTERRARQAPSGSAAAKACAGREGLLDLEDDEAARHGLPVIGAEWSGQLRTAERLASI